MDPLNEAQELIDDAVDAAEAIFRPGQQQRAMAGVKEAALGSAKEGAAQAGQAVAGAARGPAQVRAEAVAGAGREAACPDGWR